LKSAYAWLIELKKLMLFYIRGNRKENMNQSTFTSYMNQSKILSSPEYYQGYHYGLRRYYHGDNFGEDKIIEKMKNRGEEIADGVNDVRYGKKPDTKQ